MQSEWLDLDVLISRVAQEDSDAFWELYDRTVFPLFNLCIAIVPDRKQAEDCLQDIYQRIWEGAHRYHFDELNSTAWLVTIARNTAIEHRHAIGYQSDYFAGILGALKEQSKHRKRNISNPCATQVEHCLGQLDPVYANMIRSAYLHGASYIQLSSTTSISIDRIRTQLRHSLQKVRECLHVAEIVNADRSILAAEYALGLMKGFEAKAFARRLEEEPLLYQEYEIWLEHFSPLIFELPNSDVASNLKTRVENHMFGESNSKISPRLWLVFLESKFLAGSFLLILLGLMLYLATMNNK